MSHVVPRRRATAHALSARMVEAARAVESGRLPRQAAAVLLHRADANSARAAEVLRVALWNAAR